MIIKIGGCNGSGKTSMVRALFDELTFKAEYWKGNSGKVKQYAASTNHLLKINGSISQFFDKVVVLGDYRNVCGGMDTISDKEVRLTLVEEYCAFNKANERTLVIYEGLITGKTYGAMGALSDRTRLPWLYAFMDTPFAVCAARVLARRKAKGNDAPFDPERTMRSTFKSCQSVAVKAQANGHQVLMMDHTQPPETLAQSLLTHAVVAAKKASK